MNLKELLDKHTKERTGLLSTNKRGDTAVIIEYYDSHNCTISFEENIKVEGIEYANFIKGKFLNPFTKSVAGVGYLGQGKFKGSRNVQSYNMWRAIIKRCYDEKQLEKYPTYKNVTVCEEWHNFQNFAAWFEENYKDEYMQGWEIDKDIICKECKIYSPETCAFVPQEINKSLSMRVNKRSDSFLGVYKRNGRYTSRINIKGKNYNFGMFNTIEEAFKPYKEARENFVKNLAKKWKDKIDIRVYNALLNYNIENIYKNLLNTHHKPIESPYLVANIIDDILEFNSKWEEF